MSDTNEGSSAHDPEESSPPSFAELLRFTVSAMPIYVSPVILSLIDTAVVGQISAAQLAAMGPACGILDALSALMVFISVGTTNAVSTALGSGDKQAAKRAASVSVLLSCAIGCLVAMLLYASIGPIIANGVMPAAVASTIAQTGGDTAAVAATKQLWASCEVYVKIRSLSFPAALVIMSAQASCLGSKDSASPTLATLLAALVNIVGDAFLVLGPPAMGIAGAAWATVSCQFVAAATLLRTLGQKRLLDRQELQVLPTRQEVKKFFAFGAFLLVLISKQVTWYQAVLLATILGTAAGAAHQCIFSLVRVCCTMGDVTGTTAQSFLPRYYVTDEDSGRVTFNATAARGTIKRIVAMTAFVAACNTAIIFGVALFKPGLLTADLEVMRLMRRAAPYAAVGLLMHPSVLGIEGCLLATKDLRWLVANYFATGALSVLSTQMFLKFPPFRSLLNLNVIWVYLTCFQALRFLTFLWRLLTNTIGGASSKLKPSLST